MSDIPSVSASSLESYEKATADLLKSEAVKIFCDSTGLGIEGLVFAGRTQDAGHEGELMRIDVTPARHESMHGFDLVVTYD